MNQVIRPYRRFFPRLMSNIPKRYILHVLKEYIDKSSIPDGYSFPSPSEDDEIIVAMSSGVDSSVCAALYASQYKKVRGIYMANWSQTAKCTEADWNDVRKVCEQLEIPCERVNFEKEYWNDVFQPMISMYEKGLTPNPDVGCNKYVKFGKMIEHLTRKFENSQKWWLVTGHYARVLKHQQTSEYHLLRGFHRQKDQSYYLSTVPADILSRVIMPMGHLEKPLVRKVAADLDLITAKKPDSQGLCFVSQEENNFRKFLNDYIEPRPGNIVTKDGKIWGKHQGLWHATIGQKLGISMPQGDPEYKGVWFVSEKRPETNELVIVRGRDNEEFYKNGLIVKEWEWLLPIPIDLQEKLKFSRLNIQYRSLQQEELVSSIDIEQDTIDMKLHNKCRAMAPGQYIVLYENDRVLGSGVLHETYRQ